MNKILLATLICEALLAGCCREIYVTDLPIDIKVQYFPNKKQIEQIEVSAKNLSYNIWFYSDGTLHSEDIWTKYNSDSIESLGPSIGYDY